MVPILPGIITGSTRTTARRWVDWRREDSNLVTPVPSASPVRGTTVQVPALYLGPFFGIPAKLRRPKPPPGRVPPLTERGGFGPALLGLANEPGGRPKS